ncbi:MAG TPA: hypothetical protein VMH20_07690 [Verrucomicrobiae bacterium]|nr:hypothetical protein [Verrucomicrobiae bacterium]
MNIGKEGATFKTSFCERYEELLMQSQDALETWSKRQGEIQELGLQGKAVGSELTRLQADFAKAYARLQRHTRECELCQLVSKLSGTTVNTAGYYVNEGSSRPA